jgi:hypothetical protein
MTIVYPGGLNVCPFNRVYKELGPFCVAVTVAVNTAAAATNHFNISKYSG